MPVTKTDTVVIGSGISGLTVAALLARAGRAVTIVEKQRHPGGALRRFSRAGVPFDIGFHYTGGLDRGQSLRALWDYLGVSAGITTVPLDPAGCDLFRVRGLDREIRAGYTYDQLQNELCTVFPTESRGISKYLETVRDICRTVPFYNLELPLTPFLRGAPETSSPLLTEYLTAVTGNAALQAVLASPAFLYGVPPRFADLARHAVVAHGYYTGAWGIVGGGQAVVEALLAILARDGVEILTDSPARRITVTDGRVAGVLAGEHEISTQNVVYTAHPRYLPDLLPESTLRPAYRTRLRELTNTISMFSVFGELDQPDELPRLDWANLYLLSPGFDLLEQPATAALGSLMLTAPGRRDGRGSRAARGVILMRPAAMDEVSRFDLGVNKRRPDYEDWKARETEMMLDCAARAFGEACRKIRPLASGSPLTFRDELDTPDGGIYGVQHNRLQHPAAARTKLPGLYLSGQSSLMPGVMGASMAAVVSAGEIVGLEDLWDKVRQWS